MINFNAISVGCKELEIGNNFMPGFYWQPSKFHFLPRFGLRCVFLNCFHFLVIDFVISPCQCQRRKKRKFISVTKKAELLKNIEENLPKK